MHLTLLIVRKGFVKRKSSLCVFVYSTRCFFSNLTTPKQTRRVIFLKPYTFHEFISALLIFLPTYEKFNMHKLLRQKFYVSHLEAIKFLRSDARKLHTIVGIRVLAAINYIFCLKLFLTRVCQNKIALGSSRNFKWILFFKSIWREFKVYWKIRLIHNIYGIDREIF